MPACSGGWWQERGRHLLPLKRRTVRVSWEKEGQMKEGEWDNQEHGGSRIIKSIGRLDNQKDYQDYQDYQELKGKKDYEK